MFYIDKTDRELSQTPTDKGDARALGELLNEYGLPADWDEEAEMTADFGLRNTVTRGLPREGRLLARNRLNPAIQFRNQ